MRHHNHYSEKPPVPWAERYATINRLIALQRAGVLRMWLDGGKLYLDRPRLLLLEDPCRRFVTWEEAAKIAEAGVLPDWKN